MRPSGGLYPGVKVEVPATRRDVEQGRGAGGGQARRVTARDPPNRCVATDPRSTDARPAKSSAGFGGLGFSGKSCGPAGLRHVRTGVRGAR